MANRLDLHNKLKALLGSENVYYQPPESKKMEYPAIRYSKDDIESTFADDQSYMSSNKYTITVIDRMPDNPVIQKILGLPMSSFERHYVSDNLNHDVLNLYF